ncbi:hypothetical protein ABIA06_004448 [Bradyrhizobium yuanmingense]|uniref:Uncharacterized protein n=1 Tax=Bradyrhizobium yuanmingense TaxID=108015 RepID=A0A1C3USU5_9BRAD|nr:hypothetical protein IQ15_00323 [Bradyrhizobium yuanmingense]SCB18531.1 hypothetical protein GA0061099_1002627 [Bradyrhizobium yuanmingense]
MMLRCMSPHVALQLHWKIAASPLVLGLKRTSVDGQPLNAYTA